MKPELLAVRAINQYRRRDVLAYLGLRYYFENTCAVADRWAIDISSHLVQTKNLPIYYRSYHFKELDDEGKPIHRNIYIPGPNEAFAEAMLLNECSYHPAFEPLACVYSYRFPEHDSKEGIYRSYFPGFQKRHQSIANQCLTLTDAKVLYTDIKKFYPSIKKDLALSSWRNACETARLSPKSRELGERILSDHYSASLVFKEGLGLLTGPMFSHLIANLVLANIDQKMNELMGGRYWRYVDDMVLVGNADELKNGREQLSLALDELGFKLHDEKKDFTVDASIWLGGMNDFDDASSKAWISLIANIKYFLVAYPEKRDELANIFLDNGLNIPLLNYAQTVMESTYLERFSDWVRNRWRARSIRGLTIRRLVYDAVEVREIYNKGMRSLLVKYPNMTEYERKRLIPKLRFYAGRLIYLSTLDDLSDIIPELSNYPELSLQVEVMKAIQTRDVSSLLNFGSNAVQAASQVLRINKESVKCDLDKVSDVEIQGLAILRLNGIQVDFTDNSIVDKIVEDPLNQFAQDHDIAALMKSKDLFVKEMACLYGLAGPSRHTATLDTAFDRDEHLMFDIINQLQDSSYF